jgi:hypothetical protein
VREVISLAEAAHDRDHPRSDNADPDDPDGDAV